MEGNGTMRATVTVSLPPKLKRELDKLAKEEGATRSDIVRRSISKYAAARRTSGRSSSPKVSPAICR